MIITNIETARKIIQIIAGVLHAALLAMLFILVLIIICGAGYLVGYLQDKELREKEGDNGGT